jgi:hypothetical protein
MSKGMNPEEDSKFDEGVIGAIDAGLELLASGKEPEPKTDEPEETVSEMEEIDHDSPPTPEIELEAEAKPVEKTEPEKTPEEIAAGDPEKGTPVPPEEEGDPAAPKPEVKAKPSDEFGDLEADAKPATKERFTKMKTRFDEVSTELERVSGQNMAWMDTIKRTGASPDQLGASLAYLEDINHGTPESLERAYQTMQGELQVLAKALGKEAPGYDPLEAYPDLKQKIEDGYIDRVDALEIASGRARVNFETARKTPAAPTRERAVESGTADLSNLGRRLRAADPMYDSKLPQIEKIVENVVTSGADPATWAKLVEGAYKLITIAPKPAPPKPPVTPNSIRPGNAGTKSGNYSKQPGSILEAVDLALSRGR